MNKHAEQYSQQIITFIDILGFRNVIDSGRLEPATINAILHTLKMTSEALGEGGLVHIPGFKSFSFSDSIVRCSPISDPRPQAFETLEAELILLARIQYQTIQKGFLLRGAVTIGPVFTDDSTAFGPGLNRAYEIEQRISVYPRIALDPSIWSALKTELRRGRFFNCQLDATDGIYFVDYLACVNEASLLSHKEKVIEIYNDRCKSAAISDNTLPKFLWLYEYHNRMASSRLSKTQAINYSNLCLVPSDLTDISEPTKDG